MGRREISATVAQSIRSAAAASGNTIESVATATDVPVSKLVNHPAAGALTVNEMARVGGFFSVPVASLLKGVAA